MKNRALQTTWIFHASFVRLWEIWTNPDLVTNGWGPDGFTNTIHKMDFVEGGEYK